jgi:uncharacterized protein (DUF1697 family)
MADLRALVARLGFATPGPSAERQSVFRSDRRSPAQLERVLEAERCVASASRRPVSSAPREMARGRRGNPFRAEAARDPARLAVMFLRDAPAALAVAALRAAITGREAVRAAGRHLYVVYPDGMGRSRLTHTLIEKLLGTRATGRNWNTVRKLADAVEA